MPTIKVDRAFRNKLAQAMADTDATFGSSKFVVSKSTGTATLAAGANLVFATSGSGTQIGTGATQKMGFWGATPAAQPSGATQAALADDSGGTSGGNTIAVVTDNASAANAIATLAAKVNAIRAALVTLGLIKGSA